jgi:phosphoenolpyruvate-protein phosphotransferase (PTS system enzyme I)
MTDAEDIIPIVLSGTPASPGVATGPVEVISHRDLDISSEPIPNSAISENLNKAEKALERVKSQLLALQSTQDNQEIVEILEAQIEIVNDPELLARVKQIISKEFKSAGFALYSAFNEFIQLLQQSGQDWIKDRIIDIQSLRDMIIHQTSGSNFLQDNAEGAILFTEELSPTELIEFSDSEIAGIVMQHGGTTSHSVIIAQSLGIPCIIGVEWKRTQIGKSAVAAVDATAGEVIINPDQETLKEYLQRQREDEIKKQKVHDIRKLPDQTDCGESFYLRGNIEFEEELKRVEEFQAKGIGLLRTETLFLRQGYFDTDRHIALYQKVLDSTTPYPVVIRLLDVGGDKLPGKKIQESNPFLGWRGIRMLLDETTLLESQLKAAFISASKFPGRVKLLVPMISDIDEIIKTQKIIDKVKSELVNIDLSRDEVPIGIMVEVPSVALMAHEFAPHVDFFSIGTNDLTQYTLAADRGNERVSRHFNSNHPSIWKLIKMTFNAATNASIPISVCGEMAGQPVMAAALLGMGIRDLSMNPASIPYVKKMLCKSRIEECRVLFNKVLNSSGGQEADYHAESWSDKILKKD